MKKTWFYVIFFLVLTGGFLYFSLNDYDFSRSKLGVINPSIPDFSFVDHNGKTITQKDVDGKVHVAEYFFTTCKGICPKMNANMRRVFESYKKEPDFLILSHTCMPETDSIPVLKAYEEKMLKGKLIRKTDGSYSFSGEINQAPSENSNWYFLTGDKRKLYDMARNGYMIDNGAPDTAQINDQFIHTQFFALVDRNRRVRGIYDGLKSDEVDQMMRDIRDLLEEKVKSARFLTGFSNNPG
ncbi:MAG: SCO family protein [Chitinophagaceae bacterium]|nr:MAG: SCO family protein [Chitinophagaceae bacterium]